MQLFGSNFNEKYIVAFVAGSLFGGGFVYVACKLLSRRSKTTSGRNIGNLFNRNDVDCEADLMLPVTLEQEYGNFRKTCMSSDETASAYLKQLPEHFFQFQEKFAQLIIGTLENKKCTRALVIGSKTGALTFNLSKYFTHVKGLERSFSQVATCYRFQNLDQLDYRFPLEGSLKTASRTIISPLTQLPTGNLLSWKKNHKLKEYERIEFINCDTFDLPDYIGEFELVIVNNCLNEVSDPEQFLCSLAKFVEPHGTLVISSDYNWKRETNVDSGFGGLPVFNSFELLQFFLKTNFTLIEDHHIPEIFCISNRTCQISNNHVTLWSRNIDANTVP